ncbi:MAG: prepilin-type cleavage/methylation domain-containing protein [Gammaproteobacteria bacterium]|nr:prepilin-type cleavage/methylation domain-containing protein [Gammaproteobacteria bacterium]
MQSASRNQLHMGQIEHKQRIRPKSRSAGFGLFDLMVTVVIVCMLATLAVPAYDRAVRRAHVAKAVGDISSLALAIEQFRLNNDNRMPASLLELGIDIPLDPWGRPYAYLNIQTAPPGSGSLRKDGKLNPLNSDFDFYSRGRDGLSKLPLNARESRDDIVRANNGAFIGLAEDY